MGPRTGKQIAVAMTERDERDFLAFLRTTGDIRLLALGNRTQGAAWVDAFRPRRDRDGLTECCVLWNAAFDWKSDLIHGVPNYAHAPVIEYVRHPFFHPSPGWGRLYWPRNMRPEVTHCTDTDFAPWWRTVTDWVETHSHHREGKKDAAVHYLPWAWWRYGKWGLG